MYQLAATAHPGNRGSPADDPNAGMPIAVLKMVSVKAAKEGALAQSSGIGYPVPARPLREPLTKIR